MYMEAWRIRSIKVFNSVGVAASVVVVVVVVYIRIENVIPKIKVEN